MKSVFKGYISFGLVTIPVKLYSAVESQALGFRLLCGKCHTPIHYQRYCQKCKKDVKWEDVVKGLEISKGKFFVLTKEKIEKFKPKKSEYIEVVEFVDMGSIDPLYFDKHYYLVPSAAREKAYWLFKEVLSSSAKMAIGRYIMREKEYTCAIHSYKNGLLLTNLSYSYEIRDIGKITELKGKSKLGAGELKLAKELINKLYEDEFDITKFKDTFAEKLKKEIKKSIKKKVVVVKEEEKPKETKNLMQALKASVKK